MAELFNKLDNITNIIINNNKIKSRGTGNANKGILTSIIEYNFKFSPELLAPVLVVGYPTYSEYKNGATDLFKKSTLAGGYKYQRSYNFSNGSKFTSFHNIIYDKHVLEGTFTTCNFPEDSFKGDWKINDIIETFIPHGPGIIKSIMACEWFNKDNNEKLHAKIESEYYFNHNEELPNLHWRHIKFSNNYDNNKYTQNEKITVFNSMNHGEPLNMFLKK